MSNSEKSILVVDDDPILRELLVDTLTTIGYKAIAAKSGEEALEMLPNLSVDLVVTDIKMDIIDGIELLARLRKSSPDLPVLMISGVDAPDIIGRAAPDGFLPKPFRIQAIEEQIEKALTARKKKPQGKGKRVLIVDDDQTFREMLTDSLIHADFNPIAVSSGEEALEVIEKETFETVVTDIRMPTMDGITLARRIRDRLPDIPIVIMTAYSSRSKAEQDTGPIPTEHFLMKPFDINQLVDLINELAPAHI
jgi:CheY-like chemotaxis protein